eukprot:602694-Pelagomonas_calceolata.AAC.3
MLGARQHRLGLCNGGDVQERELEVGRHDRWLLGKILRHRRGVVIAAERTGGDVQKHELEVGGCRSCTTNRVTAAKCTEGTFKSTWIAARQAAQHVWQESRRQTVLCQLFTQLSPFTLASVQAGRLPLGMHYQRRRVCSNQHDSLGQVYTCRSRVQPKNASNPHINTEEGARLSGIIEIDTCFVGAEWSKFCSVVLRQAPHIPKSTPRAIGQKDGCQNACSGPSFSHDQTLRKGWAKFGPKALRARSLMSVSGRQKWCKHGNQALYLNTI